MNKIISICLGLMMIVSGVNLSYASQADRNTHYYANQFEIIKVFTETTDGYQLEGTPTRLEGALLMYRLLGASAEGKQKTYKHVFNDVPKSASNAIGYLYHNRYVMGISHNQFGSQRPINATGFATLLLRVLGYSDARREFSYNQALDLLKDKKILSTTLYKEVQKGRFKRKHMIEMVYNTLKASVKNTKKTLVESLIIKGGLDPQSAKKIGVLPVDYKPIESKVTTYKTNHNGNNYLQFDVTKQKVILSGQTDAINHNWLWARVEGTNKKKYDHHQYVQDGKILMNVDKPMGNGQYTMSIYTNNEQYGTYQSWMYDIPILIEDKQWLFPLAQVYGNNYEKYYFGKGVLNMDALLKPSEDVQSEDKKMMQLAKKITRAYDSKYDKAMAIHDWVADNIYYDKDAFHQGKYGALDALGVLKEKKSVCQGYATLTAALMRAVGIPCAVVAGYALGITTEGDWAEVSDEVANHAWNECYIDGRWVIMDTTWDSRNEFINGKYVYGGMLSREYFDTTIEHFSTKHKIMEYCWYY